MALVAPIDWPAIETTLHSVINTVSGLNTIWSHQSTPNNYPYAVLRLFGPSKIGGPDELRYVTDLSQPAGQEVSIEAVGLREITLSCEVFVGSPDANDAAKNARNYLAIVQSSLGLPSVLDQLRPAGLAVISEGRIENLDEGQGNEHVSRGKIEIRLMLSSSIEERTGFIKTVEISSTGLGDANFNKEIIGDQS
jgi:hypothetical protein